MKKYYLLILLAVLSYSCETPDNVNISKLVKEEIPQYKIYPNFVGNYQGEFYGVKEYVTITEEHISVYLDDETINLDVNVDEVLDFGSCIMKIKANNSTITFKSGNYQSLKIYVTNDRVTDYYLGRFDKINPNLEQQLN